MGDVEIVITKPTAMRGGLDEGRLEHQFKELSDQTASYIGRNVDERTRSHIQRILEAMVADFGWLDGGVTVVLKSDVEPVTISLMFQFGRREIVDGEWSAWHPLNLNDEGEGLEEGQQYQKRVRNSPEGPWREGPVLKWRSAEEE